MHLDDPVKLKSVLSKIEHELDMMEKSWRIPDKKIENRRFSFGYVKLLSEAFYIKGQLSVLESEIKFDKNAKCDYIG
jgi:hypothetical protein